MKLKDIKKENPFSVPENYFDNFYENLQPKLKEHKTYVFINFSRKNTLRILSTVTAILIGLFIIFVSPNIIEKNINLTETEYFTEEEYLVNLISEMGELSFVELLYEDQPEETPIDDDVLEDYVLENFSEYELFLELSN